LQKLDVSRNSTLLQVISLPPSLSQLELGETPALGFPSRALFGLKGNKTLCKGRALSALKKWLVDAAALNAATYRMHPTGELAHRTFFDFSVGTCADAVKDFMEDRHSVDFVADVSSGKPSSSHVRGSQGGCFIVADGHLGVVSAEHAIEQLPMLLQAGDVYRVKNKDAAGKLIAETITQLDERLCDMLTKTGVEDGATLSVVTVNSDGVGTVCWLGDSRVVVGRGDGTATPLSIDHKPDNAAEVCFFLWLSKFFLTTRG
jgi:hypothetical protein